MLRFSPGIAQGCYELLLLAKKHPNSAPYFLSAFSSFGSIVRIPAIVTGDSGERDRVGVARIDCRLGLVFWVLTPLFQTQ